MIDIVKSAIYLAGSDIHVHAHYGRGDRNYDVCARGKVETRQITAECRT